MTDGHKLRIIHTLLLISISLVAAFILVLACTPPTSTDALVHHLAVPRLWIEHGGFYEIPFMLHSYYPMNLDLLYTIPLIFKNDIIPKYIHLFFGLLTAFLVYRYLKKRADKTYALVGAGLLLSAPVVVRLSTTCSVDLGFLFFSSLALLGLIEWRKKNLKAKWFLVSAVSCGLALGTKYDGLILFLLLILSVPYFCVERGGNPITALACGFFYALIALAVFSPWMIKNYTLTANPIYPLYDSIFNGPRPAWWSSGGLPGIMALVCDETLWEKILVPFRMFFEAENRGAERFRMLLTPILFVFLPFGFLNKEGERKRDDVWYLLLFAILYFLIVLFTVQVSVGCMLPLVTPLVILAAYGIKNCYYLYGMTSKILCTSVCALLLAVNGQYLYQQFMICEPVSCITKEVSRDQYLGKRLEDYEAFRFINKSLPEDAKIMFLFMGNRGYYCNRQYIYDTYFSGVTLKEIIQKSESTDEIRSALRKMKVTHLLMNNHLAWKFVRSNLNRNEENLFKNLIERDSKLLFTGSGYSLYDLS